MFLLSLSTRRSEIAADRTGMMECGADPRTYHASALDRPHRAAVNRRTRLILWLTVPVFALVFLVVRRAWLAYLRTLSLGELHMRIFDHSTAVALGCGGYASYSPQSSSGYSPVA